MCSLLILFCWWKDWPRFSRCLHTFHPWISTVSLLICNLKWFWGWGLGNSILGVQKAIIKDWWHYHSARIIILVGDSEKRWVSITFILLYFFSGCRTTSLPTSKSLVRVQIKRLCVRLAEQHQSFSFINSLQMHFGGIS